MIPYLPPGVVTLVRCWVVGTRWTKPMNTLLEGRWVMSKKHYKKKNNTNNNNNNLVSNSIWAGTKINENSKMKLLLLWHCLWQNQYDKLDKNTQYLWWKLKASPLKSLVLHFTVLQNRHNRGPLICLKICSKMAYAQLKKVDNDAIWPFM